MIAQQDTLFGPPEWVVLCDGRRCEAKVTDPTSREAVIVKAAHHGWLIASRRHPDDLAEDLCRKCQDEQYG